MSCLLEIIQDRVVVSGKMAQHLIAVTPISEIPLTCMTNPP